MVDVQIFGLEAGGHHLMSVAIHGLNSMLLFIVLLRATGSAWRSGFVAALFAVHPLHVESVAWISERKDVLSTFFLFLTLWAYLFYAERPNVKRYACVVSFFGMSLMSKSMGVTLPFALLLLDWWPLFRFEDVAPRTDEVRRPFPFASLQKLILEKVPLLVMAAGSAAITLHHNKGTSWVASLEDYPHSMRAANAIVSYATYLWKTVYPMSLSAFYPHPASTLGYIPAWEIVGSTLLLVGLSLLALRQIRRRPYLAVGWLWYLGMLVPVIGLVQVSQQAMADRYTYIPLIGIFIAFAWAIPEVSRGGRFRKSALGAFIGTWLVALSIATWAQTGYWRDSTTLFSHALEVTKSNWLALNNLCASYNALGQYQLSIGYCRDALRIKPDYFPAWNNLGQSYAALGQYQQAIACYRESLKISPDDADARKKLAALSGKVGPHL